MRTCKSERLFSSGFLNDFFMCLTGAKNDCKKAPREFLCVAGVVQGPLCSLSHACFLPGTPALLAASLPLGSLCHQLAAVALGCEEEEALWHVSRLCNALVASIQ